MLTTPSRPPAYQALRDSLRRTAREALPRLGDTISVSADSLRTTIAAADSVARRVLPELDRLGRQEARYDSLAAAIQQPPSFTELSLSDQLAAGWYGLGLLGLLIGTPIIWSRTREGEVRFTSPVYDEVRDEIALYERTNEVLERVRYNLSFREGKEVEASAGGILGWFGVSGRQSSQKSREERPFTVLGLVQEYREYATDVVQYLRRERPEFRIVVCIDELDKVLDSERLHQMLKSVKAVFEIPHVYYLLSISEDALGTYRLRHVQTKNEVDSAFTHIFTVPPMGAAGSARFFVEDWKDQAYAPPRWLADFIPAGIVFGGGVPRDMHRLLHRFAMHAEAWTAADDPLAACLEAFWREDRDAAADLLQQNPALSDAWRHRWIEELDDVAPTRLGDDPVRAVQAWLDALTAISLDRFTRENPCDTEVAKDTLHRTRSMLRGMAVKSYLYHRLHTDPALRVPDKTALLRFLRSSGREEPSPDVRPWLDALEPLRDAVFHLASNPLGVWERVR